MKKYICLFALLIARSISASAIPEYEIGSIDGPILTFTNEAVLQVLHKDHKVVRDWHVGDKIKLVAGDEGLFFFVSSRIVDGHFVLNSGFKLRNEDEDEEHAAVWLWTAPTTPNPGTFLITNIDLDDHRIVLSNMTAWEYHKDERAKVEAFQIGDIVMIGINSSFLHAAEFDAVLINADRQFIIEAIQQ